MTSSRCSGPRTLNGHNVNGAKKRADIASLVRPVQASKAAIGAALCVGFMPWSVRPMRRNHRDGGLLAPAVLALLGFTRLSLPALETIAIALRGLIGYLRVTGGVLSPLVVGSPGAGGSRTFRRTAAVQRRRRRPPRSSSARRRHRSRRAITSSRSDPDLEIYAFPRSPPSSRQPRRRAARERQQAADLAVAEGAAMYRFLANAMDLISALFPDGASFRQSRRADYSTRPPIMSLAPSALVHPVISDHAGGPS